MTIPLPPLNEPIIDAVVQKLKDNLPAAISAINAADTKHIVLEAVDINLAILDYIPAPTELTRFPTIAVSDGPSTFKDDVGWGATGIHELVVVVYVVDEDQHTLAIKLRRMLKAVTGVVLWQRAIPPAWGVNLIGVDPGPTLGSTEGPRVWMSYAAVTIRCFSEEDTP